jgi:hypothetical protein
LHFHPRVDLGDSSYTLVPGGGDEGASGELQYVDVGVVYRQTVNLCRLCVGPRWLALVIPGFILVWASEE